MALTPTRRAGASKAKAGPVVVVVVDFKPPGELG